MKRAIDKYRFLLYIAVIMGMASCSPDTDAPTVPAPVREGMPLAFSLPREATGVPSLDYALYVFSRNNAAEKYQLDSILPTLNTSTRLRFSNQDLSEKTYRFLFTASPAANNEIKITHSDPAVTLAKGATWDQIRLQSLTPTLSVDNYYDVVDMTGSDILSTDSIKGHLTRIVGQMIFQFSKTGSSVNDIQPIRDTTITSIFDRIYDIEIKYEGFTTSLSFDDAGNPQPSDISVAGTPLTQHIVTQPDDSLRIPLPQLPLDMIGNDLSNGGRILGLCLLPSLKNIRVRLTFQYYDTTPICETKHIHSITCYDPRKLELNLPLQSAADGISVEANAYTVNKAGIRCNRIIDIRTEHQITINTDWNIK